MLFAGLGSSALGKTLPEVLTEYGRTQNQGKKFFLIRMNQGRQMTSLFSYLFLRVSFEHRKRYCCMQNLQEIRSGNAENVLFNLSRNIVALQVETLFCAYYHVCDQLLSQQNGVAQSRLKFYFSATNFSCAARITTEATASFATNL